MSEYFKIAGIDGMPTIGGCCINNNIPSGTYVDILYKQPNDTNVKSGTLSGNIYDYDMITVFNKHDSTEIAHGTKYSPKDIPLTNGRHHMWCLAGQGNVYFTDQIISFNNGTAFSTYPITNSASIRGANNTITGTTSTWGHYNTYVNSHCGIGMIIGTKYYKSRELIYSANNDTRTNNIELSKPYSAFERLQFKVKNQWSETNPASSIENVGWWTEVYALPDANTGFKLDFIAGEGGACYMYEDSCKFTDYTHITSYGLKPMVWSVTTTAAVGVSPNNSGNYYISEIWGLK